MLWRTCFHLGNRCCWMLPAVDRHGNQILYDECSTRLADGLQIHFFRELSWKEASTEYADSSALSTDRFSPVLDQIRLDQSSRRSFNGSVVPFVRFQHLCKFSASTRRNLQAVCEVLDVKHPWQARRLTRTHCSLNSRT